MRNQSACAHIAVVRSGLKIDNLFERRRLSPLAFYLRGVIEIAGHNIDGHHLPQDRPHKPRSTRGGVPTKKRRKDKSSLLIVDVIVTHVLEFSSAILILPVLHCNTQVAECTQGAP
jgi:hypothetical protein